MSKHPDVAKIESSIEPWYWNLPGDDYAAVWLREHPAWWRRELVAKETLLAEMLRKTA